MTKHYYNRAMISFVFKVPGRTHFFAAVCFCFFSLSFYPADLQAEDKPVGRILAVIGTVKYFVAKDSSASRGTPGEVKRVAFEPWQNVKKRQPVYATDQFRTGRKSRLKILFSDNSLMALGPGAEMTVTAYRTQPESKFRQGVIDVKRGLVMYIVNKSQNHKKSFLNIITPTANIGARGTQGYIASSDKKTLVANQAGAVGVKSSDPDIDVQVNVGSMMKTVVRAGAPPVTPRPLSENELATFRNFGVGDLAFSGGSKNALISVDEVKEEEEEDEEEKEGDEKGEPGEDGEGEGKEGEEGEGESEEGGKTQRIKAFGDMTSEEKEEMMEERMAMEDESRERQGLAPLPRTAEAREEFLEDAIAGGMEFLGQAEMGGLESAQALGILPGGVEFDDMDIDVESLQSFETAVIGACAAPLKKAAMPTRAYAPAGAVNPGNNECTRWP